MVGLISEQSGMSRILITIKINCVSSLRLDGWRFIVGKVQVLLVVVY